LLREGYRPESLRRRRRTMARLRCWLEHRRMSLALLDERGVRGFLSWRSKHGGVMRGERRTLQKFLAYLRARGIAPARVPPLPRPHDEILADFAKYARCVQGLRESTVARYMRRIRAFLSHCFGDSKPLLRRLTGSEIIGFFRKCLSVKSRSVANETRAAVCTFLRYAHVNGLTSSDLRPSIPKIRKPGNHGPPKFTDVASIEALLASSRRETAVGLRNRAVLLLLARLGLRPLEVGRMVLTDIDWEKSALLVRGKRDRIDLVPFSREIGIALAAYIQRGRPRCENSTLFLCCQAPYRDLGNANISDIVLCELRRAKIDAPRTGAYLLRHSFSARLLRQGASLADLGSALRHGNPLSTRTYVHIEIDQLRLLAQRWPGRMSTDEKTM
jgi:integrase/recombinase XerD